MNISEKELIYRLALINTKGIGPQKARMIRARWGSVHEAYQQIRSEGDVEVTPYLKRCISKMGAQIEKAKRAYDELKSFGIDVISQDCKSYPDRLLHCSDAPFLLFSKGRALKKHKRVVSIIGTRKPTKQGIDNCRNIVEELQAMDVCVVSGLAIGIDTVAHRTALQMGIHTEAVVAHGLDHVYPRSNSSLFHEITEIGRILSEFGLGVKPFPSHFPMRNRIVAGMSDATIVIESGLKGGSMITANIAHSYDRVVMAIPGQTSDSNYKGCHALIKSLKAALVENATDVAQNLGWEYESDTLEMQRRKQHKELDLKALTLDEINVYKTIEKMTNVDIEGLQHSLSINPSKLASLLLQLEMLGHVRVHPSKGYSINHV